ncbi:MAG: polysaccharide deacetylase family protein [Rhodanobacteraceae bacterium]
MTARLCIAVHDVAPITWPQCESLLKLISEFGSPPVTLLVVPDYHRHGRLIESPKVVRAIDSWVHRGAEVALHGYSHCDESAPPRRTGDWVRRRVLTAGEGEFSALAASEAARRIRRGWSELVDLGWPTRGFVAPAWLSSGGTWTALCDSPLRYASTRRSLVLLEDMREIHAPALSLSVRSCWRRRISRAWLHWFRATMAAAPLLRIALHPSDAQHDDVMEDWRRVLGALLTQREPVTKAQALGLA